MLDTNLTTTPKTSVLMGLEAYRWLTGIMLKITPYNSASSPVASAFFKSHSFILSSKKKPHSETSLKHKLIGGLDRI